MPLFNLSLTEALSISPLFLDLLPVGVLIFDPDGSLRVSNKALKDIAGYPREESQLYKKILEAIKEQRELQEIEICDKTWDGKKVILSVSTYMLPQSESEYGLLAVVQNITAFRELENAVLQVEKLAILGQLAAGCAHEIRNPLTAIKGFIQLLKNQLIGSPKEAYIEILMAEIERINTILEDFLHLAKPSRTRRTINSYEEIILEIKRLFESEAVLKNIQVMCCIEPDLPLVKLDREQIKQVLINVVKNAFEAMPDGGRLEIKVNYNRENNLVRTRIKDTGEGIGQESLNKIFDTFFTTKKGGIGLGLGMSKQIIKKHGGKYR
ncbi:MAG: PAS domain-containing sensor histidine kinase [Firmicutes bacterium]|nr:PAS domain-containing sensor histidine kinase [Bacillota bacterium]